MGTRLILTIVGLMTLLCACRSAQSLEVTASACVDTRATYFQDGTSTTLSITATTCRDGTVVAPMESAFDRLGRAGWPVPGMTVDRVSITVERYAEHPAGDAPKTLVLMPSQADERWGRHPVPPGADGPRDVALLGDNLVVLGLFALTVTVLILAVVGLVLGVRRGEIVVVWWWL